MFQIYSFFFHHAIIAIQLAVESRLSTANLIPISCSQQADCKVGVMHCFILISDHHLQLSPQKIFVNNKRFIDRG